MAQQSNTRLSHDFQNFRGLNWNYYIQHSKHIAFSWHPTLIQNFAFCGMVIKELVDENLRVFSFVLINLKITRGVPTHNHTPRGQTTKGYHSFNRRGISNIYHFATYFNLTKFATGHLRIMMMLDAGRTDRREG